MRGMSENFLRRSHFDQAAGVHHSNTVRYLRHDGQIMGDEQHRQGEFLAQLAKQVKHLRLDGDIERSGWLVGDQQRRPVHHGHGNHHALALSAGELVWIVARAPVGIGDGDGAQRFNRALPGLLLADSPDLMAGSVLEGAQLQLRRSGRCWRWGFSPWGFVCVRQHRFRDLVAHAHHRIERGHRLLKNHADSGAPNVAHLRFWYGEQILTAKMNVAVNARLRGKQPQDGQRADRLPRARLPHESQHLARRDLKTHIANGGHVSLSSREFDSEISDLEQRGHKVMLAGELRIPHSARVAVANLTEIGYNELTAFQRWRKPARSAESPAARPAGVASCGSLLFAQSTRIQRESVCTRIAVVVTLLFVPAGRENHAWFGAYVSGHAAVLA